MEVFWGTIAVIVVALGVVFFFGRMRAQEMSEYLHSGDDFTVSEWHYDGTNAIAYDAGRRRLRFAAQRGKIITGSDFAGKDIIEAKLYDSGTVVAQTGGGLVGGIVGGVGLGVVGGRKNKMSVNVGLHVVVRDPAKPSWSVNFGDISEAKADMAEMIRSDALKQARHWYAVVAAMVDADSEQPQDASDMSKNPVSDVTRLRELADMLDKGLLSAEEFQAAKSRLLRDS